MLFRSWIDELMPHTAGDIKEVLLQLKKRPTFAEQWPNEYRAGLAKGKARVLKLEQIRNQSVTMADILAARQEVLKWWLEIE